MSKSRQKAVALLRKTRFLVFAEMLRYRKKRRDARNHNTLFIEKNPHFKVPPYALMYDAYSHCDLPAYIESGIYSAQSIAGIIRKVKKEQDLVVCEWGCGPARVVRHLKAVDAGIHKVIGTDYNKKSIEWCKQALPDIEFHQNELEPPLPIPSSSLDVLYCISVFTHLSESMHFAWMEEIRRVLKPGGLFIGTFHGLKSAERLLLPEELEMFNSGNLVVRDKVKEGTRLYASFHSDKFVRDKLLAGFKDVSNFNLDKWEQTLWCAIK